MDILIETYTPAEANMVVESTQDGKNVWLSGIFMQAEIRNRNGRVYPMTEMSTAVKEAKQRIKENNGIFGELDHPQNLTVNLDRISHVITEMEIKGNDVIGKARLLNTPMGLIAKELVNSGVRVGVSSRGAGNVSEGGDVSSYSMVTVDIVATPSAMGATPNVVYESLEQAKNGQKIMTLAEHMQHDDAAQKYFKQEIMKWLETGLFKKG
jgi:hypothetical protein